MTARQEWTAEGVEALLSELTPEAVASESYGVSDDEWALFEAASVLSEFDPEALLAARPVDESLLRSLLEHSTAVGDGEGLRWRLNADVRKAALRRLGNRPAMMRAAAANRQAGSDPLQAALDAAFSEKQGPLSAQSAEELAHTLQVSEWLFDVLDGLPDPDDVRRALRLAYLLQPFRHLVGTHFAGRKDELQRLRDYVGVLAAGSKVEVVRRTVRGAFGIKERPPLVIHGVGGVGKSTLIAKFILEHGDPAAPPTIPFAYLDFDRPGIAAEEPASILVEAADQLGIQQPQRSGDWAANRSHWIGLLADERRSLGAASRKGKEPPPAAPRARKAVLDEFAQMFGSSFGHELPLLLVLDTFEEVQYRSDAFVDELWRFLDELQRRVPSLRTVLAGRAPLEGKKTDELALTGFDRVSAAAFLENQGIDHAMAAELSRRLDGNPLTLRLAAEVVRQDPEALSAISSMASHGLFRAVQQGVIQGVLYKRILDHIHEEDVRKLAHPGLVVRRITPEVLQDVLAGPCGVVVETREEAARLFEALRREVTLVRPAEGGALEHRSDVRRVMLPLLRRTRPEAVLAINQAAVAYYERRRGVINRAEEIYHRLALGQPAGEVDKRWVSGIEDRLRGAVDELPPSGQTFLASRVGVTLDPAVWALASEEENRRRLAQEASDLIQVQQFEAARKALASVELGDRGFTLGLLDARAAFLLGDLEGARLAADSTLDSDDEPGPDQLDLLLLSADVEQSLDNPAAAGSRLGDAATVARWLGDRPRLLEIDLRRLQDAEEPEALDQEVLADLEHAGDDALSASPQVALGLAGELGGRHPEVIQRVAQAPDPPLAGFELAMEDLAPILALWIDELKGRLLPTEVVSGTSPAEVLTSLVARFPLTSGAASAIAELLRETAAPAPAPDVLRSFRPQPAPAGAEVHEADVVLRGGGVKALALVGALRGFAERGWTDWVSVAGVSGGSIVAALLACGHSAEDVEMILRNAPFADFKGDGSRRGRLERGERGASSGEFFRQWILEQTSHRTFGSVTAGGRSLKLIAADVTCGEPLLFPDDLVQYRLPGQKTPIDPDSFTIGDAVRMSMSIPFLFDHIELVRLDTGRPSVIVDGGIIPGCPVWLFDQVDGDIRRPTFAFQLAGEPRKDAAAPVKGGDWATRLGVDLFEAAVDSWDKRAVPHSASVRTCVIPSGPIATTDFDLSAAQRDWLVQSGREAAARFLDVFGPEQYTNTFGRTLAPALRPGVR
jgi:cellulose synthase operon protein C